MQRPRANDHAGRMDRSVAGAALDPQGEFDQIIDFRIGLHRRCQFRNFLDRLRNTHVSAANRRRDHLGDALDIPVRHIQHTADILDSGPRCHRSECNDLTDRIASIKLGNVIDHIASAPNAEIDIDIRHRDSLGIQKSLEQQFMLERINVSDPHTVSRKRTRG